MNTEDHLQNIEDALYCPNCLYLSVFFCVLIWRNPLWRTKVCASRVSELLKLGVKSDDF